MHWLSILSNFEYNISSYLLAEEPRERVELKLLLKLLLSLLLLASSKVKSIDKKNENENTIYDIHCMVRKSTHGTAMM